MRKQSTVYSYPVAHTMNEETFYTVIRLPIPFMRKRCTFIMLPIPYMRKMHVGKFYTIILLPLPYMRKHLRPVFTLQSYSLCVMSELNPGPLPRCPTCELLY